MKVFGILCLTLGVVSAARSGPYLPSGWKPSGPAFLLPGEVQKPVDNPHKETLQIEAEGSDFLREYGPPSEDLSKQNLPDVIIERSFAEIKSNEIAETNTEIKTAVAGEVKPEQMFEAFTETAEETIDEITATTASNEVVTEKVVAETEGEALVEIKEIIETATEQLEEQVTEIPVVEEESAKNPEIPENDNANSDLVVVREKEEKSVVAEVEEREGKSVDVTEVKIEKEIEGVKNIEEALVNLEKEIKSQQVKTVDIEEKIVQENAATLEQAPEGFLEYGPPGFREYGPPKELLRSENEEKEAVESNETRRRRFSPKLRLARKAHH